MYFSVNLVQGFCGSLCIYLEVLLDLSERSLDTKFSTYFIMHARFFYFLFFIFYRNLGAQQYKTWKE